MARRMFNSDIILSDSFLDMPGETQLLYFHLSMNADDDGFVGNPKMVQRSIGSSEDSLRLLIAKKFIISFDSGIVVIKHWRINNQIRKDRYRETKYLKEKTSLYIRENGSYTTNPDNAVRISQGFFAVESLFKRLPTGCQDGCHLVDPDKIRIDKVREEEIREISSAYKNGDKIRYKPFFMGEEMRWKDQWWVIPKGGGQWCEYAGTENEIEWRRI
jgi:hypothetical protein